MSKLKLDFDKVRTCMCAAHSAEDCICGAWDDHGNLRPYAARIKELEAELKAEKEIRAVFINAQNERNMQ
jgi:hypothetical protein